MPSIACKWLCITFYSNAINLSHPVLLVQCFALIYTDGWQSFFSLMINNRQYRTQKAKLMYHKTV